MIIDFFWWIILFSVDRDFRKYWKKDMLVTVKMMMDEININRTIKTQSYLVSPSDAQGKCHNSSWGFVGRKHFLGDLWHACGWTYTPRNEWLDHNLTSSSGSCFHSPSRLVILRLFSYGADEEFLFVRSLRSWKLVGGATHDEAFLVQQLTRGLYLW